MAYITKFEIKHFRGIESLELNIAEKHKCPVVTLVGLNESGKTTILEAISHFVTQEGTISRERGKIDATNLLALVPIAKKANFTGTIEISGTVALEELDIKNIEQIFKNGGLLVNVEQIPSQFKIRRMYDFQDGEFKKTTNLWDLNFYTKKNNRVKGFAKYDRPNTEEKETPDLWLKCLESIQNSLPAIAYFPTFLVDVPDRIYLTEHDNELANQQYYREVLQDVLDSLDENLDLEQHVVKRIQNFQAQEKNPNWISRLFSGPEKGKIDSVVTKLQSAISKEVIGSWQNVFNRPISAKLITVEWNVDLEKDNIPYLTFGISDGESKYALHERSLGFRWFFLFLLFTRFKRKKKRPTLFLFDEPAANLHARAQSELLKSLDKIVENRNGIIYSTHSAYMINPKWIPAAHIVENSAINYDSNEEMLSFSSPPTLISVIPYRRFVSSNSERTTYFQPILDKLDYISPVIAPDCPVIVTEGISDYHAFSFYCSELLKSSRIHLLPGLGDSNHDIQIASLIGKSIGFIVILDDDFSGVKGANRYRDNWLLDTNHIATVGELHTDAKGKKLETLLTDDSISDISAHFSHTNYPSKKEIGLYFAEANAGLITKKNINTERIMKNIINEAINRLQKQNSN